MKAKGFILASLVSLALVGGAIYVVQDEKVQEKKKESAAQVFSWESDQVTEIQIYGQEKIRLEKGKEGKWWLTEPLREEALASQVEEFLASILKEKSQEGFSEKNDVGSDLFGFKEPAGKIVLKKADGQTAEVQVSKVVNFAGDPYILRASDNRIYLGFSSWKSRLEKKAFDFRDKRIMPLSMSNIEEVQLIFPARKMTLSRKDAKWVVSERPGWTIDQSKAQELIAMLNQSDVSGIEHEGELKNIKLKNFGLDKPLFQMEVRLREGKKWNSKWGMSSTNEYFVLSADPSRIVRVSPTDAGKFAKVEASDFRDRKEFFVFDRGAVKEVDLLVGTNPVSLIEKEGKWTLKPQDNSKEIDQDKLKTLINRLTTLETDFFPEEVSQSVKVKNSLALKSQDGGLVFKLEIGDVVQKKRNGETANFHLVKTNVSNQWLAVAQEQVTQLALSEIVKSKLGPEVTPKVETK